MMTILIVDDSPTSCMVLKVYLQAIGQTEVHSAADPEQALVLAERHKPAVVFMDYNLEGANGIELATAMRARGSEAKFILLTGDKLESRTDAAMQAGFYAALQKPVSPEEIENVFKDC